jgi:hypothetical protein
MRYLVEVLSHRFLLEGSLQGKIWQEVKVRESENKSMNSVYAIVTVLIGLFISILLVSISYDKKRKKIIEYERTGEITITPESAPRYIQRDYTVIHKKSDGKTAISRVRANNRLSAKYKAIKEFGIELHSILSVV